MFFHHRSTLQGQKVYKYSINLEQQVYFSLQDKSEAQKRIKTLNDTKPNTPEPHKTKHVLLYSFTTTIKHGSIYKYI
jgi:hypothetical protein